MIATAVETRSRSPRVSEETKAYELGMASLCQDRGFWNLARSHQLAAGLFLPEGIRAEDLARSWVHDADLRAAAAAPASSRRS